MPDASSGRPGSSSAYSPQSVFRFRDGRLCGLHTRAQGTFLLSVSEQKRVWSGVFRHRHLLKDRPAASYQGLFAAFQKAFESGETMVLMQSAESLVLCITFTHLGVEHDLRLTLAECTNAAELEAFRWHLLVDVFRALERSRTHSQSVQGQLATALRAAMRPASPARAEQPVAPPPSARAAGGRAGATRQGHPQRKVAPQLEAIEPWRPVNARRPSLIGRSADEKHELAEAAAHRRAQLSTVQKGAWSFAMLESRQRMQQTLLQQEALLRGLRDRGDLQSPPPPPSPPPEPPPPQRADRGPPRSPGRAVPTAVVQLPPAEDASPPGLSSGQPQAPQRVGSAPVSRGSDRGKGGVELPGDGRADWGFAQAFPPPGAPGVLRSAPQQHQLMAPVTGEKVAVREEREQTASRLQREREKRQRQRPGARLPAATPPAPDPQGEPAAAGDPGPGEPEDGGGT
eukprot:TRINITY_DN11573_c0_g1_i1.p1 TRINITY_DN11573_c0_g1~~TRINITY_DN11573_c0_g1_i1.p1  ORF type:complete len:457 (+),score=85.43 TRINITY_DN11573_c0_g1_i1:91-1461(+)